jgi:hypothetical protein
MDSGAMIGYACGAPLQEFLSDGAERAVDQTYAAIPNMLPSGLILRVVLAGQATAGTAPTAFTTSAAFFTSSLFAAAFFTSSLFAAAFLRGSRGRSAG